MVWLPSTLLYRANLVNCLCYLLFKATGAVGAWLGSLHFVSIPAELLGSCRGISIFHQFVLVDQGCFFCSKVCPRVRFLFRLGLLVLPLDLGWTTLVDFTFGGFDLNNAPVLSHFDIPKPGHLSQALSIHSSISDVDTQLKPSLLPQNLEQILEELRCI